MNNPTLPHHPLHPISPFIRYLLFILCLLLTILALQPAAFAQTTLDVNIPGDAGDINPGNGICETGHNNGECTLTAAIEEANALDGAVTITLPFRVTVNLAPETTDDCFDIGSLGYSVLPPITSDITIEGNGSIIERASDAANCRILTVVNDTNNNGALTLNDTTIRNGVTSGDGNTNAAVGGGILTDGSVVTLNRVTVADNTARSTNFGGGGVFSTFTGASLTLNHSTVSGNSAPNGFGGGILCHDGSLTLNHSTVSGNSANDNGGGIFTACPTTMTHSSVVDNSSTSGGGGFHNEFGPTTLRNSLIAANSGIPANCQVFFSSRPFPRRRQPDR